jgi:hypothetical protein
LVFSNLSQFVYWGNENTKKLTGLQIKLPDNRNDRDKIIKYALSAYSFNVLPVNFLEIIEDDSNKENINIIQKCYIKAGETYFTRATTLFSTIARDINLEEIGLVKIENVNPQVLRKKSNMRSKLKPFDLKEIAPLSTVYVTSANKIKLEMEEINLKKRRLEL